MQENSPESEAKQAKPAAKKSTPSKKPAKKTARKRSTAKSGAKPAKRRRKPARRAGEQAKDAEVKAALAAAQAAADETKALKEALEASKRALEAANDREADIRAEADRQRKDFEARAASDAQWMREELSKLRAETQAVRAQMHDEEPRRASSQSQWDEHEEQTEKRRGDRPALFGGFARKLFSKSGEALGLSDEGVRNLVEEQFPKETVVGLVEQALKSKDEVARIKDDLTRTALRGREEVGRLRGDLQKTMGREIRRQVERLDLRDEIAKMLADYTLEITARLSFVPATEEEEAQEEGAPSSKKKAKGKGRKKDDLKIRLIRKESREDDYGLGASEAERLHPHRYFDDDDDDDYDD